MSDVTPTAAKRRHRRLGIWALAAVVGLVSPTLASARPVFRGTAITYMKAFTVMYWDSLNGTRVVATGGGSGSSPSLSADGRYLTYARNDGGDFNCYRIHLVDTRTFSQVPLPGSGPIAAADCNTTPRLSVDGRYLVWSAPGPVTATTDQQQDIVLYDTVAQTKITLPAIINSTGVETSPALARVPSTGDWLLEFVSDRSKYGQVYVADLGVNMANISAGTVTLLPTPGLPAGAFTYNEQNGVISADGSAIAYETGPDLAHVVHVYSLATGAVNDQPVFSSANATTSPSLNADGSVLLMTRFVAGDLITHLWTYNRSTGALSAQSALFSGPGEDSGSIATPVDLYDTTPPRVRGFHCAQAGTRVRCVLSVSKPVSGVVTLRIGRWQKRVPVHTRRAGQVSVVFKLGRTTGAARAQAVLVDPSGNRAKAASNRFAVR